MQLLNALCTLVIHHVQLLCSQCSLGLKERVTECLPASLYRAMSLMEAAFSVATLKQPFSPMATALAQYFFANCAALGFIMGLASATYWLLISEDSDYEKKDMLIILQMQILLWQI